MNRKFLYLLSIFLAAACAPQPWTESDHGTYRTVHQKGAPVLGYSPASGVSILTVDGRPFKDLNRNGVLDPYEDWRLSPEKRAIDLAGKMSIEQICGLMIYSSAQQVLDSAALTPKQIGFLRDDHVRHVLISDIASPRMGAEWANNVQAFCEAEPLGIPANNSTDPRNYTNGQANTSTYKHEPDGEFDPDGSSNISRWPREIGMAATFDMDVIQKHGEIVSQEYRALGITTALSPQIDMASDPRWRRFYGTFSESPYLCRDIARTYCDAFQTTIFDFVSSGTCQMCLEKLLGTRLQGLYFEQVRDGVRSKQGLFVSDFLQEKSGQETEWNYFYFEPLIKQAVPTILNFDKNGHPVYGMEHLDMNQKEFVLEVQRGVMAFAEESGVSRREVSEKMDFAALQFLDDECLGIGQRLVNYDAFTNRVIEWSM